MTQVVLGKSVQGKSIWTDLKLLLRTRLLIQANSGGGKSWLLRLLAELLFGKVQVIIIDREGEFSSLRPKFGYLHVGQVSEGADIQVDVRSARLLAEKLLELGVSAICDLYETFRTNPSGRRAWVAAFLEGLIDAPKALWHDCVVIVDEAHQFCPQESPKAASMVEREIISRCKEAMVALATVGRKRGFCAIWATQRLAKLDKDASAELFNRLVGMTIEDVDVDRAVDLMSVSREDRQSFKKTLRDLDPGNFFAFGRAITKERTLIKVDPVATKHQEPGSKAYSAKPPPVPQVIKALLPQLADLSKQAETQARTEADLRAENRSLKAQLAAKPRPVVQAPAPIKTEITKITVPAIKEGDLKRVERAVLQAGNVAETFETAAKHLLQTSIALRGIGREVKVQAARKTPLAPFASLGRNAVATAARALDRSEPAKKAGNGDLIAGERKMLHVLGQIHPGVLTRAQLGRLSGYTPSGGTFGQYYGRLKREGYVQERAETIDGRSCETVSLTALGIGTFPDGLPQGPTTPEERIEFWRERLKGGELKMFDHLVSIFPKTVTPEELGQATGYTAEGGTFGQYLGTLRRNRLAVAEDQGYRASPELFELETSGGGR